MQSNMYIWKDKQFTLKEMFFAFSMQLILFTKCLWPKFVQLGLDSFLKKKE